MAILATAIETYALPPAGTISGLTASSHFSGALDDTGLIGGALLDDAKAASLVQPAPKSLVETGPHGPANAAANNYFEAVGVPNPQAYLSQLEAFWSAYKGSAWYTEVKRVDGACPLNHPTTAEVLQWAAYKWGMSPLLLYAEASQEGDWDQTSLGDNQTSSGVLQVADRGVNHAFPGFAGAGANLARENTCFNADFWAAHLWSTFNGLTGECPRRLDISGAIQTWYDGSATCAGGGYTKTVYGHLLKQDWVGRFFSQPIPGGLLHK